MAVNVGQAYYFICHAYYHVIAEVVAVTGKREADVCRVVWVHSCRRGWTDFFADGAREDTTCHRFPDGSISWIAAFEWLHPIPEASRAS